ncbi:uncharacterized protein ZBAI_02353 [Zygosaccharomyces bailii ISA1307]|nr:uncharacterized protein ZBAI_02353 [Zygosaccharomyces bailii ISA1307]
MSELTVSYGLLPPQSRCSQNLHILPISKILYPYDRDDYFITCGRDGSVIRHRCTAEGVSLGGTKVQAHNDWVSDIIQRDVDSFITVSYDFSIVLLTWRPELENWETEIIGDHEDYIKCIVEIPTDVDDGSFTFATGGLDKKVKIWKLDQNQAQCIHVFDNAQANDTGSIYCMNSVQRGKSLPFDLIVGDSNGDLVFYSCQQRTEFSRVKNIHKTNMKTLKMFDDCTKLVSTCSDGLICVWDLTEVVNVLKIMASFKWDCSIWCIEGDCLEELYVGDAKGRITRADFSDVQNVRLEMVYESHAAIEAIDATVNNGISSKESKKKHVGIVCINWLPNNFLLFSRSVDSNLNRLDLANNQVTVSEGGIALTKSSLLTNRRHVITENTKGEIQRWDLVVCELLDTFDPSEGNFDQVVSKYTSQEILSHWCSVSVKVGLLFVKLNKRILNTEVYGTALKDYDVVNGVQPNPDERYNLGKIVANSLFNEFVMFEMHKDKLYRQGLVPKKRNNSFFHNEATPVGEMQDSKYKDRRRKSAFYKISYPNSVTEKGTLGSLSAPNSPFLASQTPTPPKDRPLLGPPALSDRATATLTKNNLENGEGANFPPSKGSEGRTMSSGSLLSRKLRIFKNANNRAFTATNAATDSAISDAEDSALDDDTKEIGNTTSETIGNSAGYHTENAQQQMYNCDTKIATTNDTTETGPTNSDPKKKIKEESLSDLMIQFHENYKQQVTNNTSTLKMLAKKPPQTKIVRDNLSPIVRVTNGVLIVVHSWEKSSCGGRVLFSTYLPPRNADYMKVLDKENAEDDEDIDDSILEPLPQPQQQERYSGETEKAGEDNLAENEYTNGKNRKQVYEQLECILPYWFSKILFCDSRVVKQQPKLNFVITPWRSSEPGGLQVGQPQPQQSPLQHYKMKFGRVTSRSTDLLVGTTDLPRVSESNLKLLAPGMIKVKKIKAYIVDRFETRTPEMKSKLEPSEWLELLCKGQVLDNDMTLSTVRTLYWKSQSDIVFEYRRRMAAPS